MNLYTQRDNIKWVVALCALAISGISLWYTRALVSTLEDRERKLIGLLAKAYQTIGSSEYDPSQAFLFREIIETNNSVPVILTYENGEVSIHRNLGLPKDLSEAETDRRIARELAKMKEQYPPILIDVPGLRQYVYYRQSDLIRRLQLYPYVQLGVIGVFAVFAYLAFSYSRRAEQNRVWVGLAKETAHQLGTPLSSLMAWVEYLRLDERLAQEEFIGEIEKDVLRLQTVTERFSQIGSAPQLTAEPIAPVVRALADYLSRRISTLVTMTVNIPADLEPAQVKLNRALFEWVLENLIKNAVDAMTGRGLVTITLQTTPDNRLVLDVSDTGKGMTKAQQRRVFDPGYTTKQRGWGLGLTLSKRIIEGYHGGRLTVRHSVPGQGTTFRILLPLAPVVEQSPTKRAQKVIVT